MEELSLLENSIMEMVRERNTTFKQIKRKLRIRSEEGIDDLYSALYNLEVRGYIYLNDYDEYQLFSKDPSLSIGELHINKQGKAYVVSGNNIIFIPDTHLNGAITGDIVVVKRNNYTVRTKTKGVIDKVLVRKRGELIFDYINGEFVPYDFPFPIDIIVDKKEQERLVDGSRVLMDVSLDEIDGAFICSVKSIIGHKDDPQLDVKTIVSANGIVIDFSPEALAQAERIPVSVSESEIEERLHKENTLDLRDRTIFTIDGINTKDIDDAISIWKKDNGNYVLGVHIADVSHYIKPNTPLDLEGRSRSTSYYPYRYVIAMLPHSLSNGICSLNPGVDRLAFSCMMEIDKTGEIVDFEFLDTIIRSRKKMTYEDINDIFEKGIPHHDYDPYLGDLSMMVELSSILSERKRNRGYISFGEHDVYYDDNDGVAIGVTKGHRGIAENLIENFMLCANETAASFVYWLDMPGIYRVHPTPNVKKIQTIIQSLGLAIRIPNNADNPRVLQGILEKIAEVDEGDVFSDYLLQSMARACYSPKNIGHFGLALDNYTHFTSPIRRYMDLRTHRIIRTIRDDILSIDPDELYEDLQRNCAYASEREMIADKTERDVNKYKMAEFMEQHIGETFVGYISYISRSGITIKTDNLISGKVPIKSLECDGFKLNEKTLSVSNGESEFYIGDKVEVTVLSADKSVGKVEFVINRQLGRAKVKSLYKKAQ